MSCNFGFILRAFLFCTNIQRSNQWVDVYVFYVTSGKGHWSPSNRLNQILFLSYVVSQLYD